MNLGVFCISIDFELLWGRRDMPNLDYFEKRIPEERKVINRILKLFEKYDIPATWAMVGKIYEIGDPNYSGIDIIKKIEKVKDQEIGSHSYTHAVFTEITKNKAINEFIKFKKKSFVFPRNKVKYLQELKSAGFKTYRGADNNERELLLPRIPPVYTPIFNNGLLNIQGSMYFVSGRGLKKILPQGLRFVKSRMGIDSAIKQNKIFHLWFHPMDFVDDSKKIFDDFEKVLIYANKKRSEKKLQILNMNQIQTQFS
jgi:hypothetical protein